MGVISGFIQQHRGRLVATGGDSVLAEFTSVVDAVRCAVGIQEELKERNKDVTEKRRMEFRIGVNLGDVVEEGDNILGDGVNIAARVQSLAEAGGICITGTAYDHVKNKLALGYAYVGEQTVKNIKDPVRVYRVLLEPGVKKTAVGLCSKVKSKRTLALGVLVAFVLIAITAALYLFAFRPSSPKTEVASKEKLAFPLPDKPSIAVLPFTTMSSEKELEYFSDGLVEGIITALSKIPRLYVIARNSTFTYKGKPVKVKQVSEELGVRYVLEGSVQKAGDRLRITAQLIDALNGHHLWADRYERDLKNFDLFALQDEVTTKILTAMRVKLTEGEQAAKYEKNFRGKEGLECYFKVLEWLNCFELVSIEGNNAARRIAEELVAKWPKNPWSYLCMGWVHRVDVMLGTTKSRQESIEKAMDLVQKALAMDDSISNAHSLLGSIYVAKGENDKAIAEGERAVALEPGGADAHMMYGNSLVMAGRAEEGIPMLQKAIRLNPYGSASSFMSLGRAYSSTGRFEAAVSAYKKSLLKGPDSIVTHLGLAASYIALGREKEARAEAAEVLRINPKFALDDYAKGMPEKDQSAKDKFIGALRMAGLK
jgi:adenylate cyclase